MKLPSQLHAALYTSSIESGYDLDAACQISPAMTIKTHRNMMLVRSKFRYT